MILRSLALTSALALSACASSSVIPVSHNQFILSTTAAPACGRSGAVKVASQMAAVETIRRGYTRFTIGGVDAQNNTQVGYTPATSARTRGTIYAGGGYSANTTLYGSRPIVFGSQDASLGVTMYKAGEPGYSRAVDARSALGPNWEELVRTGVQTCTG